MNRKNKKGGFWLGEETLKLIIGIIALGFLVYLAASLYFSAKTSKELEQAEASLNFLVGEAKAGSENVDIYNPEGWWVMHWTQTEELFAEKKPGYNIPETCSGIQPENCLCFCPETRFGCVGGICTDGGGFSVENSTKIENPPITLNIDQANKKISRG